MAAKGDNIRAISNFIEEFPLQEILETAETVAPFIPGIGQVMMIIIRIIKVLIRLKPAVGKALNASAQLADDTAPKEAPAISVQRQKFDSLLAIASSDGYISPEEKQFLHEKAVAAGIDEDEFEAIILNVR